MKLGKRGRPPMKRTTSMTEFTLEDLNGVVQDQGQQHDVYDHAHSINPFSDQVYMNSAAVSPRLRRRNSADLVATAHFLRTCALCKHRLIPGHDIYMYRGDSAFCSLECREQQMTQDERKDQCSVVASNKEAARAATGAQASTTGETVAAV